MKDCSFCAGKKWWRHEEGIHYSNADEKYYRDFISTLARILKSATDSIDLPIRHYPEQKKIKNYEWRASEMIPTVQFGAGLRLKNSARRVRCYDYAV